MAKKHTVKKSSKKKKVIRKRKAARQKPSVVSVIACDSVIQQVPSGKLALHGLFDRILVSDPTKPFRPFSVFVKLFGGKGAYRTGMTIKTPDGSFLNDVGAKQEVTFGPEEFHQAISVVSNFDVSRPGLYLIFVELDGKPFDNPCPIEVVHSQEKEASQRE